jgi:DNA-binding transcriptional LysR family regulator
MELRQLRVFVAVAEEGSFTRAADRLHIVQSAVSSGIRTLEGELGARLFDRSTRQVGLSDAGRALLPEARAVLSAAALALDSVQQVGRGLRGSISLGTMQAQGMRAISVARLLAAFRVDHPDVEVSVRHVGGSAEMAKRVREGRLDLAFVSLTDGRPRGLTLEPLASEPMMLACPPAHPLASRATVELADLSEEPFVDLPEGWGMRMASDGAFAAAHTNRQVAFEVNDSASILDFVREGLAVALLPPSFAEQAPELELIPLRRHAPTFDTLLAQPLERRPTAAVKAFVAIIHQTTRRAQTTTAGSSPSGEAA